MLPKQFRVSGRRHLRRMFARGLAAFNGTIRTLIPTFPTAKMSSSVRVPPVPGAKPFRIALVQLGGVSGDKQANLMHAREMILKAANGTGGPRPDFVVLPVSPHILIYSDRLACQPWN